MSTRRGFTLIELLVALVLIQVGLLALAGTRALVVRAAESGRARALATQVGVDRLETLSARTCIVGSGTAFDAHDIRERWVVSRLGNGTREIADSVTFVVGGAEHSFVLRTRTLC
jgi:prepilin-type N-terminal cleavage/methylation domain-containing protein